MAHGCLGITPAPSHPVPLSAAAPS
jgi:hypothetical protein